jgi:hypothetical protein
MTEKDLHIRGVTPECHKKLKVYSAFIGKPQKEAIDKALTVALSQWLGKPNLVFQDVLEANMDKQDATTEEYKENQKHP